jgi:hypothetical protein
MALKTAKKVPRFRNEAEEAEWWGSHDTAEIFQSGKPARPIKMPPAQVDFINKRAASRKQAISIRLDPAQIEAAKRIAARKSIGYQTQLRLWIAEGLTREA